MHLFAIIQTIFAASFLLAGLVALFGIGITGLLFLLPGALFAVVAGIVMDRSRAAIAAALALDGLLAWMAARKLGALFAGDMALAGVGPLDYLLPGAALVLVAIGVLGVAADWRGLRDAAWF